eukprot:2097539-Amphidinium_carterae.1
MPEFGHMGERLDDREVEKKSYTFVILRAVEVSLMITDTSLANVASTFVECLPSMLELRAKKAHEHKLLDKPLQTTKMVQIA